MSLTRYHEDDALPCASCGVPVYETADPWQEYTLCDSCAPVKESLTFQVLITQLEALQEALRTLGDYVSFVVESALPALTRDVYNLVVTYPDYLDEKVMQIAEEFELCDDNERQYENPHESIP